jgi:hypothetical protein
VPTPRTRPPGNRCAKRDTEKVQAASSRDRILDAALRECANRGLFGATVDVIAKQAAISAACKGGDCTHPNKDLPTLFRSEEERDRFMPRPPPALVDDLASV